jgi:hypothetical protein
MSSLIRVVTRRPTQNAYQGPGMRSLPFEPSRPIVSTVGGPSGIVMMQRAYRPSRSHNTQGLLLFSLSPRKPALFGEYSSFHHRSPGSTRVACKPNRISFFSSMTSIKHHLAQRCQASNRHLTLSARRNLIITPLCPIPTVMEDRRKKRVG